MPKTETGKKKGKLHQLFTEDVGHPALAQHLHAVAVLMRASLNWNQFKLMLVQALPKKVTLFNSLLLMRAEAGQAVEIRCSKGFQKSENGGF